LILAFILAVYVNVVYDSTVI